MNDHADIIVIGAGLAGLNAALTAHLAGRSVVLLEASDAIGGRVRTDIVDGLQLDRGFQILNPAYPELQRLGVLEELDLRAFDAGIMVATEQGIARLGDPLRLPHWLLSALSPSTGDIQDKAKLVAALGKSWMRASLDTPNNTVGSVSASLLRDGVSDRMYARLLKPFLTGVFLDDPERVAAGYGDFVLRSFISGTPAVPSRGMGALPAALAMRLPYDAIRCGVKVSRVESGRVESSEGSFTGGAVIIAVNPNQAREWFPRIGVPETRSCTTWYHVTETSPTADRAILVDALHRGPVVNSVAISKVAPSYASRGRVLISSTTLGNIASVEQEMQVRSHLAQMWGVATSDWDLVRTDVIEEALPSMPVGHPLTQQVELGDGLFVAGDHRETPSQQGALRSGRRAAEQAMRHLG